MNGPEHYREAEKLTVRAHDMADQGHEARADFILRRAQVHATLAQAAATVDAQRGGNVVWEGWPAIAEGWRL